MVDEDDDINDMFGSDNSSSDNDGEYDCNKKEQKDGGGDISDDDFSTGDIDIADSNDESTEEKRDDNLSMLDFSEPSTKHQRLDHDHDGNHAVIHTSAAPDSDVSNSSGTKMQTAAIHENIKSDNNILLEKAKSKLSKWTTRLFDPNRIKGLVEPPQIIPLNDEFLIQFGKREKEYDESIGRKINIDTTEITLEYDKVEEHALLAKGEPNHNNESTNDEQDNHQQPQEKTSLSSSKKRKRHQERKGCKVRIANLAYTTSESTLKNNCELFGPIVDINLIMDDENSDMNVGRAYVTYENDHDANKCIAELKVLDGRMLRLSIADDQKDGNRSSSEGQNLRYYQNIGISSSKCNICGKVGHVSKRCPYDQTIRKCSLCGSIGKHEIRSCPLNKICFTCGVPGHINKDCIFRGRGPPKRVVCAICFESGHHSSSCYTNILDVSSTVDAKCMVCKEYGHIMCRDMKWFFSLEGVTCFNCGHKGHLGHACSRPRRNACYRDEQITRQEIYGEELGRPNSNERKEERCIVDGYDINQLVNAALGLCPMPSSPKPAPH